MASNNVWCKKGKINKIKHHLVKYYFRYVLVFITLSFFSAFLLHLLGYCTGTNSIRIIGQSITFAAISYAAYQFKLNHDWNRRKFAMEALKELKDSTTSDVLVLDKAFHYISRRKKDVIPMSIINDKIYAKKDGVFLKDENGKYIVDHNGDGHKIKRSLLNLLNSYEYISVGVNHGTIDRSIVKELNAGTIIKINAIFSEYIEDMNENMRPGRQGKIYAHLKCIAAQLEELEHPDPEVRGGIQ